MTWLLPNGSPLGEMTKTMPAHAELAAPTASGDMANTPGSAITHEASGPCAPQELVIVMPSPESGHGHISLALQIVAETSAPVLALTIVTDAASPVWPTCELVGKVGVTDRPTPA
jgi:hypothetical protein